MIDQRLGDQIDPLRNDPDAAARQRRLAELGLAHDQPQPRLDAFAAALARDAADLVGGSVPDAMVNLFVGDHQYFAGMHLTAAPNSEAGAGLRQQHTSPDRIMGLDTGWCPHVVARGLPLVLDDVFSMVRFAANPAAANLDIRSYIGAPLLDPDTGVALGTACVIARDPRPYGRAGLEFIKDRAIQATRLITGNAP
ncbi:GAF domain-containing protein [Saccharopolyspora endophytica]|uniref:GAF domain-containing protein n=1 Tax=Saccharopolyspora endophytica TaxID=543886 RepID=A0ABS5DKC2_9PSEU|nr:GAF domain-containing protein [Saccharopolyspora endophytica]